MLAAPTTTVSILRGSSIDDYSGNVVNEVVAASGVMASLMEQSRTVFDPDSGTPGIVRFITARFPVGTSVKTSDRIMDEITGITYAVKSVRQVQSPIHTNDVTAELVRTNQTDP